MVNFMCQLDMSWDAQIKHFFSGVSVKVFP